MQPKKAIIPIYSNNSFEYHLQVGSIYSNVGPTSLQKTIDAWFEGHKESHETNIPMMIFRIKLNKASWNFFYSSALYVSSKS